MKETAMWKMLLYLMLAASFLAGGPGCAQKQGEEEEKSGIEALTEQVGRDAAEEIKKPIGKARAIEDLAKKHVQEMDAAEESE
jgi:hypothetical protein